MAFDMNPAQSQDSKWNEDDVFVIGRGFKVVGDVRGSGLCVVDGEIEGSLETADVKINDTGNFNGHMKCLRLDANGPISGVVDVHEIVLRSRASLDGKLTYTLMSMEAGAVIDGEIHCAKVSQSDRQDPDFIAIPFELSVLDALSSAQSVQLTLPNGSQTPSWIVLENKGVKVGRKKLLELKRHVECYFVALTLDKNTFLIDILGSMK